MHISIILVRTFTTIVWELRTELNERLIFSRVCWALNSKHHRTSIETNNVSEINCKHRNNLIFHHVCLIVSKSTRTWAWCVWVRLKSSKKGRLCKTRVLWTPKFPERQREEKRFSLPLQSSTVSLFDGGFSSLLLGVCVDISGLRSIRKLAVCHNIICNVDTDYDFP